MISSPVNTASKICLQNLSGGFIIAYFSNYPTSLCLCQKNAYNPTCLLSLTAYVYSIYVLSGRTPFTSLCYLPFCPLLIMTQTFVQFIYIIIYYILYIIISLIHLPSSCIIHTILIFSTCTY
ncbi:hypothetical protein XELAEV_18007029mg [Xenopus laevis]|uniref:Uncharacterized protein n=1 Tax=Xenopus laevis TaxID=8355 RepID=A0A974I4R9_XENLA|nr:hypothetical protein XELAEV_18007029mg [Xenopus laevis]